MDERKAFEEWFCDGHENVAAKQNWFAKNSHGEYVDNEIHLCWASWSARAKLMLTLPVKDATGEH